MWDEMGLVRVYTKPQGQQPDFSEPVVLSTVSTPLQCSSDRENLEDSRAKCSCNAMGISYICIVSKQLRCSNVVYYINVQRAVDFSQDRGGCSVEDFCNHLHRSLLKDIKYVLVWGASSKHYPQRCGTQHVLSDEDVVQIVKKKVCTTFE